MAIGHVVDHQVSCFSLVGALGAWCAAVGDVAIREEVGGRQEGRDKGKEGGGIREEGGGEREGHFCLIIHHTKVRVHNIK